MLQEIKERIIRAEIDSQFSVGKNPEVLKESSTRAREAKNELKDWLFVAGDPRDYSNICRECREKATEYVDSESNIS